MLISFGTYQAQENITYDQALEKKHTSRMVLLKFKISLRVSGKTEIQLSGYSTNGNYRRIWPDSGARKRIIHSESLKDSVFQRCIQKRKQMLDAEWSASVINQNLTRHSLPKK